MTGCSADIVASSVRAAGDCATAEDAGKFTSIT
mgnify:CR=1 FL=1